MDGRHHHEESERRSFFKSIWDLNSTPEEEEEAVPCNNFGLLGNVGHKQFSGPQNLNDATLKRVRTKIGCFNEADISAACMLLEMSTNHSGRVAEEYSQSQKPCASIRVSDFSDRGAPAVPPLYKLLEEEVANYSGRSEAASALHTDDALGIVQERRAPWATYSSDSARPPKLELELGTLGKKRIKPGNGKRELNLFGMNQGVLGPDKYDVLDAPTRKRQYKSLRVLLGVQ